MHASYLGLRNEEPDEDEHAQAEAGEGDESTVTALAHGHQHVRHSASNDKVEEPLSGGSKRDVKATETSSRDLGHVDPADLHVSLAPTQTWVLANGKLTGPQPHWKKDAKR
jgi:hypothetical protein